MTTIGCVSPPVLVIIPIMFFVVAPPEGIRGRAGCAERGCCEQKDQRRERGCHFGQREKKEDEDVNERLVRRTNEGMKQSERLK